jgi:hypothetical protein
MKFKDGNFYATEKVSPTRVKTPEGYLICQAVPISRVGEFEYTALELCGAVKGRGGKVIMTRTPEELFRPETIASFEGKPVVIGHDRFADPQNINAIRVGHVQNVRQGEGEQSGFLLADLFLDSQRGIDIVERGELEEVSCGYDARAVDDGDGRGHQEGIVGNHLALVKKARCGEACKIGDGSMSKSHMTLKQRIRRLFRDGDEEGLNEVLDESEVVAKDDVPPAAPAEDPLVALVQRLEKLESLIAAMQTPPAPPAQDEETADEETTDEDEVCDEDEIADEGEVEQVVQDAEEVCPGMAKPVGDAKGGKFTKGMLDRVRRIALKGSGITAFGDAAELKGKALDIAFKAAVQMKRAAHNPRATQRMGDSAPKARSSNAELNARFKSYWENK